MGKLKCWAHAKINLYLDVIGKENNGYHLIQSITQTLSLADEIWLEQAPTLQVTSDLKEVPPSQNLIFKAAQVLKAETGVKKGARLKLKKAIPVAAGLGGGSADAAAVLVGLNKLWDLNLSPLFLRKMASKIGMDVPLFLQGGTILVEGKGEKLTPLPQLPQVFVVIAKPPFGILTKKAYEELDREKISPLFGLSPILKALQRKDLKEVGKNLANIFEKIAVKYFPEIESLKGRALKEGAIGALMSGSGSGFFILVEEKMKAQKIARILKNSNILTSLAKPYPQGVELLSN